MKTKTFNFLISNPTYVSIFSFGFHRARSVGASPRQYPLNSRKMQLRFYCRSRNRAAGSSRWLRAAGFEPADVAGFLPSLCVRSPGDPDRQRRSSLPARTSVRLGRTDFGTLITKTVKRFKHVHFLHCGLQTSIQ